MQVECQISSSAQSGLLLPTSCRVSIKDMCNICHCIDVRVISSVVCGVILSQQHHYVAWISSSHSTSETLLNVVLW